MLNLERKFPPFIRSIIHLRRFSFHIKRKAIKNKKLTQIQAAEILNISQPKLSELLGGRFRGYSVERLIHFLNELGQDVDIVVRAKPRSRSKACVSD